MSVSQVLTSQLSALSGDMMGVISSVLPIALSVVGAVLVVTFGIKLFKRITGK